jgi:thiol:disulfide interchange protein
MSRGVWVLVAIICVFLSVIYIRNGPATAPPPPVFADQITLAEARTRSAETGKPVLAFVSADWCAPCQSLKRGALSDDQVAAFLQENTIPVYLEDSRNASEIQSLGARVFPTTFLLFNNQVIAQIEGGGPADAYLRTVREAIEQADR